jgi:hypothetical protein
MKRRSFILVILCVLLLLLTAPTFAAEIKDVKQSSPWYESVKLLVEKGYLPLYEGSLFNGDKPVDRYTLASVIANLLKDIEAGKVKIEGPDAEFLKDLTVEFRKELVILSEDAGNLKTKFEEAERTLLILKEDIAETLVSSDKLSKSVGSLETQLATLRQEINEQDAKKRALDQDFDRLKADFESYKAKTQEELARKDAEFAAYKRRTDDQLKKTQLYILGALIVGLII